MKKIILFILCLFVFCLSSCSKPIAEDEPFLNVSVSDGKSVRNGTEAFTYTVDKGNKGICSISIERLEGRIDILVYKKGAKDKPEYEGKNLNLTFFTITVKEEGEYVIWLNEVSFVGKCEIDWKNEPLN